MKTKQYLYYPHTYDGIRKQLGADDPSTILESSPHGHEYISLKEEKTDTIIGIHRSIDVYHYYTEGHDIYNAKEVSEPLYDNDDWARIDINTTCGNGQISRRSGHHSYLSYQWDKEYHLKVSTSISSTISSLSPFTFYTTYNIKTQKALGLLMPKFIFMKMKRGRLTEFIWDDTYSKMRTIYTYE